MIAFIAPYPTSENIQDGFMQRVKNIDNIFIDYKRIYVIIHYNPFVKSTVEVVNKNLTIYHLNFFFDYLKIRKLISCCTHVYIHSIYSYSRVSFFLGKNDITLDFHGVVPEELHYNNKYLSSLRFQIIERKAVKRITRVVFVTHSMSDYFAKKYPRAKCEKVIYPIISKNALVRNKAVVDLSITEENTVFVYSGNFQKWQRIDSVLQFIMQNDNDKFVYLFLTKEKDVITKKIEMLSVKLKGRVIIETVSPTDLYLYYNLAHYGFLIRDNHILNIVANPTKMLEYLFYGLTIIVDLEKIGDYKGYEYIRCDNVCNNLFFHKSAKNVSIASTMMENEPVNLVNILFGVNNK